MTQNLTSAKYERWSTCPSQAGVVACSSTINTQQEDHVAACASPGFTHPSVQQPCLILLGTYPHQDGASSCLPVTLTRPDEDGSL